MQGDRYSRIIGWLKVLLPLAALALLSTLFLFARAPLPAGEIPYAEIESIARDPRMIGPAFAGVTDDGTAVSLTAETIRPEAGRPDAFAISDFRVLLDSTGDETVEIAASEGAFDGRTRQVVLSGLARLVASNGWQMETTGLIADLALGRVETMGRLAVRSPIGEIDAGRLAITDGGARMVFNDGVRLLYRPESSGSAP